MKEKLMQHNFPHHDVRSRTAKNVFQFLKGETKLTNGWKRKATSFSFVAMKLGENILPTSTMSCDFKRKFSFASFAVLQSVRHLSPTLKGAIMAGDGL